MRRAPPAAIGPPNAAASWLRLCAQCTLLPRLATRPRKQSFQYPLALPGTTLQAVGAWLVPLLSLELPFNLFLNYRPGKQRRPHPPCKSGTRAPDAFPAVPPWLIPVGTHLVI